MGIYLAVVGIPDACGLQVVGLDENVQLAVITEIHLAQPTTHLNWEYGSVTAEGYPMCHIHPLLKKQEYCDNRNLYPKPILQSSVSFTDI